MSFPYDTLLSIVQNERLPCLLRAVMLNLLRAIYVDRLVHFVSHTSLVLLIYVLNEYIILGVYMRVI